MGLVPLLTPKVLTLMLLASPLKGLHTGLFRSPSFRLAHLHQLANLNLLLLLLPHQHLCRSNHNPVRNLLPRLRPLEASQCMLRSQYRALP
jgi:hypothetical protein